MVDIGNTLVFVSIIYLVVVELSDRAHETNVSKAAWKRNNGLGKFGLLHAINFFLLLSAYLIVFDDFINSSYDIQLFLVLSVTFFLWLLLPVLEVRNYYDIIDQFDWTKSALSHMLPVFFLAAWPFVFAYLSNSTSIFRHPYSQLISSILIIVIYLISIYYFIYYIRFEAIRTRFPL